MFHNLPGVWPQTSPITFRKQAPCPTIPNQVQSLSHSVRTHVLVLRKIPFRTFPCAFLPLSHKPSQCESESAPNSTPERTYHSTCCFITHIRNTPAEPKPRNVLTLTSREESSWQACGGIVRCHPAPKDILTEWKVGWTIQAQQKQVFPIKS